MAMPARIWNKKQSSNALENLGHQLQAMHPAAPAEFWLKVNRRCGQNLHGRKMVISCCCKYFIACYCRLCRWFLPQYSINAQALSHLFAISAYLVYVLRSAALRLEYWYTLRSKVF